MLTEIELDFSMQVMMTASSATAQTVQSLITPVLARKGLASSINTIPIPYPFNEDMPSNPFVPMDAPYFLLLARNIVPVEKLSDFQEYVLGKFASTSLSQFVSVFVLQSHGRLLSVRLGNHK
jgi:hypothetical protein